MKFLKSFFTAIILLISIIAFSQTKTQSKPSINEAKKWIAEKLLSNAVGFEKTLSQPSLGRTDITTSKISNVTYDQINLVFEIAYTQNIYEKDRTREKSWTTTVTIPWTIFKSEKNSVFVNADTLKPYKSSSFTVESKLYNANYFLAFVSEGNQLTYTNSEVDVSQRWSNGDTDSKSEPATTEKKSFLEFGFITQEDNIIQRVKKAFS